jgi:hypothetical protein
MDDLPVWNDGDPIPPDHRGPYPPGALSGYTHADCRCRFCRAANTRARRRWRGGEATRRVAIDERIDVWASSNL